MLSTFSLTVNLKLRKIHTFAAINKAVTSNPRLMYTGDVLKPIRIPDSVTKIERLAFYGCSSLQSIVIPEGVTNIEGFAFSGCSSLQSIVIPDSVTEIGIGAFWDCSSLRSVEIPKNMKIEYDIFPETAKIIRR